MFVVWNFFRLQDKEQFILDSVPDNCLNVHNVHASVSEATHALSHNVCPCQLQ